MDNSQTGSNRGSVLSGPPSVLGRGSCHICTKNGLESVCSLHSCKFCAKVVCSDHSTRRRDLSEQVRQARLCDQCHRDIVCAGVRGECAAEIKLRRRQLQDLRDSVSRRSEDLEVKNSSISTKRSELDQYNSYRATEVVSLARSLADAQRHSTSQQQSLAHTKEAVRVARQSLMRLQERKCEKQAAADSLQADIDAATEQVPEFERKIRAGEQSLMQFFSESMALGMLCPKCKQRFLHEILQKRLVHQKVRGQTHKFCEACACM